MDEQTKRYQLLHNAALEGDLPSLLNLIEEDKFILDRFIIDKSAHFNRTPLHVASAKGHLEIVKALLEVNPSMCFVRDHDGMNPIHVSAINGQNHVIDELIRANPHVVNERTNGGETVLHLCVKHNQLETLKHLVDVRDDGVLLNSKDSHDNTILHLAVAGKQIEIINLLVNKKSMKKNAINKNELTAMDVHTENKKGVTDNEIWKSLKRSKSLGAKEARNPKKKQPAAWLKEQRSALMVVASLIATMAFQVGTNPPGGVWQDDNQDDKDRVVPHTAGLSIMANYDEYNKLITSSTIGMISSLSVILLLISGLPCKRFFMVILMIVMWIAVTSTAFTYVVSVGFVSGLRSKTCFSVIQFSTHVWIVLMLSVLIGHGIRFSFNIIKQLYNTNVRPTNTSAAAV
ncbi:unnamed protein product [Amaranthus hypochondriacus]